MVPKIEIVLMPDGKVSASAAVPNRAIFNMMMETARQDISMLLIEKEKQKVVVPDPSQTLKLQL